MLESIILKSKSIVTNYEDISVFSGTPTSIRHHLLFGKGIRELAEKDGVWIPITNEEHNLSPKGTINQIHSNPAAEKLSKMAGQLAWERHELAKLLANALGKSVDELEVTIRVQFINRYGKSYL